MYKSELEFEKDLVNALTHHGWKHGVIKNPTEEDLINNWADIIYQNNKGIDRLNNVPLSDGEKAQLIEEITKLKTPFQLNSFINDKTVTIKRDNPDDELHLGKEVSLFIFDKNQIAAGKSVYQIAEQPRYKAKTSILPDRRGDVTLLINGMPLIHIELKRSGISYTQAVHQIENYKHEGVFTGLFSLVQVFVAMTPEHTVYFANADTEKFNTKFQFEWADVNNEPYKEWNKIAEHFLSIPQAHRLIGYYTVPDSTDGVLKVMRSYQCYAVNAINNRVDKAQWTSRDKKGGYIFHTTGSGKTMTSFKSAQLISSMKKADKVVFLMDRIELGTQSIKAYRNFASATEEIQDTENTDILVGKLKSDEKNDTLIVTSIQKMSNISAESKFTSWDIAKINTKKIVFIIDECHRSNFGEMNQTIKRTFPNALFFGFTGTPIYEENGMIATTTDVFGDELHRYSIADGIRDGNVLGFDPKMVKTFDDQDVRLKVALEEARAGSISEVMQDEEKKKVYFKFMNMPMIGENGEKGIEDYIPVSQYHISENTPIEKTHPYAVVKDILKGWEVNSAGNYFSAIFATSSITEAIQYYGLFKQLMGKNGLPEIKIAALFDESIDNKGTGIIKSDALVEMLTDYNNRYFNGNTKFTIPTYQKYKVDVSWRLARKELYKYINNKPEEQLDLLIVVDQMLTGFDSKWVNTLYLDKVMVNHNIIQAFSRTNRIFGYEKQNGIIKYYRYPHTMEQNIKKAFDLYSGHNPRGVFVDKLEANLGNMNDTFSMIKRIFENEGIRNFEKNPDSVEAKSKFAKLFIEFNKYLDSAKIQEFSWDKLEYVFEYPDKPSNSVVLNLDYKTFLILVLRYKELLGKAVNESNSEFEEWEIPYDIDPHITEIDTGKIDSDYLNSRFEKFLITLQENGDNPELVESVLSELHSEFASLTQEEQRFAEMILFDIQNGQLTVDSDKTFKDYIVIYSSNTKEAQIKKFASTFGFDSQMLASMIALKLDKTNINEYGRFDKLLETKDENKDIDYFTSISDAPVRKFKANQLLSELTRRFILEGGFDL